MPQHPAPQRPTQRPGCKPSIAGLRATGEGAAGNAVHAPVSPGAAPDPDRSHRVLDFCDPCASVDQAM